MSIHQTLIFLIISYHLKITYHTYPSLVGGFNPSEKYEFVSWDYHSQDMESHKNSMVPNHHPDYNP